MRAFAKKRMDDLPGTVRPGALSDNCEKSNRSMLGKVLMISPVDDLLVLLDLQSSCAIETVYFCRQKECVCRVVLLLGMHCLC